MTMTKLDRMIAELCPDGVEYKTLGECCKLSAGGDVPKEHFSKEKTDEYFIPIYSNGIDDNALYGWTNEARINKPCVTIAARGTIGYSALHEKPFVPIIRLICAIPNECLDVKYLKYAIEILSFEVPTSGIPQLTVPMASKYIIPVPPLSIQQEIVRILDNFTELTAELTKRNKQYEYYRNELLSFGDDATWRNCGNRHRKQQYKRRA
jgi:type I restriction enzyme S subunit